MLVKFLARGTGSARDATDYLLGERDAAGKTREGVEVLRGDPHQVAAVADTLPFEHKYTSSVIAWAPEDEPTDEQIGAVLDAFIVPPISLDSTLANVPGSKGEEALNVSEIGRAGSGEEPRKAESPAEAVERAAEGRGGVAASTRRGHRRGEPGGTGCAAGTGAVAARVPGRGPAGPEGEEPDGRGADADPCEAGGDDHAGRAAVGAPRKKGVRGRASEALEALGRVSPATDRAYSLTMVCEAWRVARSSVYALRASLGGPLKPDRRQPGKRGPKTALRDDELLQEIRTVLKASPFLGEGHRKVKARLAAKGIRVGNNRVLRLMREHGLLAPVRRGHPRGDRSHSGRIRTERPDELWGTDASRFWTKAEGWCWIFAAVDHCASDVVGWHVAKKGDRWAALEPVRQGVRAHMGGFSKTIALGLGLRHDWGSQYRARQFQAEIKWLGIRAREKLSRRAA